MSKKVAAVVTKKVKVVESSSDESSEEIIITRPSRNSPRLWPRRLLSHPATSLPTTPPS